jgi:hypothetical protein
MLTLLAGSRSIRERHRMKPLPAAVSMTTSTMIFLSRSWHPCGADDDVDPTIATIAGC